MSTTSAPPATTLHDHLTSAADELNRGAPARDRDASFSHEAWAVLAGTGLFAAAVPRAYGGTELTLGALLEAAEHLGRTSYDAGLSFSAATHIASTATALARFGDDDLRARYLPDVARGTLVGSHAITEPEAGSDALGMASTGTFEGDSIVLDGDKSFVTNGPVADLTVVYVRTSADGGPLSLSAVLVPRGTPGATFGPPLEKSTLRSSPIGTLTMRGCRVPRNHVLGAPGMGFMILDHVMAREILVSFTINVGEMQRRLEATIARVRSRHQFGQPIASFQSVQDTVVDMHLSIETARLALHAAAAELERDGRATRAVAVAKLLASRANLATAQQAIELHGGTGVLTETGVEVGLRDAMGGPVYSGTSWVQRHKIARILGLP